MKITFLENTQISKELKRLMNAFDEYYWAVAWGTKNKLSDDLVANKTKIRRLTFGTHFYHSHPDFLEKFMDEEFARYMPNNTSGTFHPKVYLFVKGAEAAAIVGSANFTNGAMTKNNEAVILLEGATSDETMASIKAMVDEVWVRGEKIDQDFITDYRLHYRATAIHRNALAKPRKFVKPIKDAPNIGLRMWTWKKYAAEVKSDQYAAYDGRLNLLKEARKLFVRVNIFSEMVDDELRAIAGFLEKGKSSKVGGVEEWGWFGSMKGAGDFKNLILARNRYISDALEAIPLSGDINKEQYDEYIRLFQKAFTRASHKGGVPTASRLLAMKRPDMFLCLNNKNKTQLSKDLGFSPTTITFDKYWNEVIIPITESIWWQSARPSGQEGQLWDGRTAMLDSIYYEEPN